MRPIIYPYKFGSSGARALSESLRSQGHRSKRVRVDGNYRPYRNHLIINWGSSVEPPWLSRSVTGAPTVLNRFHWVGQTGNKLSAFQIMDRAGVPVPEYVIDWQAANDLLNSNNIVVERGCLTGHSGRGIRIIPPDMETGHHGVDRSASLWTKYIPKHKEYRIHMGKRPDGSLYIIDKQQKRRRREVPDDQVNWQVRNYQNGFTYSRHDIDEYGDTLEPACIMAMRCLNLDFGAIDVLHKVRDNSTYILEVNTAPGLEGTTLDNYKRFFELYL